MIRSPMRIRIAIVCAALVGSASLGLGGEAFADAGPRIVGHCRAPPSRRPSARRGSRILRPGESLADAAVWPDQIKTATTRMTTRPHFASNTPRRIPITTRTCPFRQNAYDASCPGPA